MLNLLSRETDAALRALLEDARLILRMKMIQGGGTLPLEGGGNVLSDLVANFGGGVARALASQKHRSGDQPPAEESDE